MSYKYKEKLTLYFVTTFVPSINAFTDLIAAPFNPLEILSLCLEHSLHLLNVTCVLLQTSIVLQPMNFP